MSGTFKTGSTGSSVAMRKVALIGPAAVGVKVIVSTRVSPGSSSKPKLGRSVKTGSPVSNARTVRSDVPELAIRVRDQGEGFDPDTVANPLDPENLLKSSGRGIFLIRNFMDDVQLQRAPEGGMEIRMVKRGQPVTADSDDSATT